MTTDAQILEGIGDYKYGFNDPDVSVYNTGKGLNREVVEQISTMKGEPQWMLDYRLKALEHYQRAIEIAPRDPRPYKEAGLLLKESKDYVAAEAMFRQAYAIDSDDIFIQRQLATVIALALIHQPNANR